MMVIITEELGIDLIGMTCLFKSTNSKNMPKEEIGLKCYFQ
jgi:hypothetical protein